MEAPPTQRPRSVRSVASNSSLASTVSLARRPRTTRARSRTVTGSCPTPTDDPPPALPSPLPREPLDDASSSAPPHTPTSPPGLEPPGGGSDATSSRVSAIEGSTFVVEPTQSTAVSATARPPPLSKASKQASSLPHLDTRPAYRAPPSAFSRDPALTPGKNVRDSLSTEQSGMSSSLYPPSTSSASGPASPLSLQIDPPSFALEVDEVQEYDGDDVAYRLRLLVQNNYFLPPAHSKPSPADFAPVSPQPQRKSPRTNAPTFLDIFRVGKSRSKPTTPTGTGPMLDDLPPMLRTTGDSITPAFALADHQPRSPALRSPAIQVPPPPRGRVVVVREKMTDIATAAKQAEQEVKARNARVLEQHGSQAENNTPVVDDDDIDPTDAVDIPLPPPSYPFAVQASALHGLGVADSVGAGELLANLLPPSRNPNLSKEYDAVEDQWRKQMLRDAVGHSLDNTPDASISLFSQPLGVGQTPVASPEPQGLKASVSLDKERKSNLNPSQTQARIQTPAQAQAQQAQQAPPQPFTQAQLLQRKITDSLPIPLIETTNAAADPRPSGESRASTSSRISMKRNLGLPSAVAEMLSINIDPMSMGMSIPRPGSTLPPRAETPVAPQTPLGPPPRRYGGQMSSIQISSSASGSSPAVAGASGSNQAKGASSPEHPSLRRTVSSPSLAEEYGYEDGMLRRSSTSPPLPLNLPVPISTVMGATANRNHRDSQATIVSSANTDWVDDGEDDDDTTRSLASYADSHEPDFEYEQNPGRVSLALSAFPAPSTRGGSRSRTRTGSEGRPSLSQSEYSQASLSPTTSAFQEMLNHPPRHSSSSAPASTAPTPEPGSSSRFAADHDKEGDKEHDVSLGESDGQDQQSERDQQQKHATYIDAARFDAMSPPPRNSSSLAFEALPAPPPRGASLAFNKNNLRNLGSNSKPSTSSHLSASTSTASSHPHPARANTHAYDGQLAHASRSYSQPPVRRYTTSTALGSSPPITLVPGPVLGPAPTAVTLEILAPEPTTPPLPPSMSFGDDTAIPALSTSASMSSPLRREPASFFDSIHTHANAMDDLDSSDDEDEDEEDEEDGDLLLEPLPLSPGARHRYPPPTSFNSGSSLGRPRTASAAGSTPPRRPMMKHSNFSAPYIHSGSAGQGLNNGSDSGHGHGSVSGHSHTSDSAPVVVSSKQAVGNVAPKASQPLGLAASSDFFRYAQEHPAAVHPAGAVAGTGPGEASTSTAARPGTSQNLKSQESLRKFDGMLQQHIEAEKDTIKRIATTLKQQNAGGSPKLGYPSHPPGLPGRR